MCDCIFIIVRSIDVIGLKEYNYSYEDGRLTRSTECTVTLNSSELVTKKNLVNSILYYYDEETKLYYLQSRYYDAEVGRFVNGDEIEVISFEQSLLATNLFAYCENNPVIYTDETGYFVVPRWLVSFIVDAILMALGVGALFAPIKTAAKKVGRKMGRTAIRKLVKTPLVKFLNSFAKLASKVLSKIRTGLKKIPLVGKKLSKSAKLKSLVNLISGGATSATVNKLLDVLVDDITCFLSFGGFYSLLWDFYSDGKINKKIVI